MPEGHTIHQIARDQGQLLAGRALRVSSPQGRFAPSAAVLDGRTLLGIEAWGKHLWYRWSGDESWLLHVHLGLFGRFRVQHYDGDGPPPPVGEVRVRLLADDVVVDLSGPTACALDAPTERAAIVARLGPDPLRADGRPERAVARIAASRAPIGTLLLDQSVIAGVGNVFRSEALFVNGIHPVRVGRDVGAEGALALWATLQRMLRAGVRDRRIVTVDPKEIGMARSRIPRGEATYVYKRAQCLRCFTPIETMVLGARTAYACPTCQPR